MIKLTMAKRILITMLMLWTFVNVVNLKPTGDSDALPHTESPKVSGLRQKLQRLHDILKDYEKHESLQDKAPEPSGGVHEEEKQPIAVAGSEDSVNVKVNTSKNQVRMLSPRETVVTHPKARAVSAEDILKTDTDEKDLVQLAKSKTKRQGDDSIQILAKALAQMRNEHPKQSAKAHDVKKNDEDAPKLVMGGEDVETSLMEELTRLLDEGKESESKENALPLFHGPQQVTGNEKVIDQDNFEKAYYALVNKLSSLNTDQGDDDEDENDNDNHNSDDDDDHEALMKYIEDAGYSLDDLNKRTPVTRDQVIENLEERLMDDIELANAAGVSVNDLIQDLEDKAFREALIRRLRRILDSQ